MDSARGRVIDRQPVPPITPSSNRSHELAGERVQAVARRHLRHLVDHRLAVVAGVGRDPEQRLGRARRGSPARRAGSRPRGRCRRAPARRAAARCRRRRRSPRSTAARVAASAPSVRRNFSLSSGPVAAPTWITASLLDSLASRSCSTSMSVSWVARSSSTRICASRALDVPRRCPRPRPARSRPR